MLNHGAISRAAATAAVLASVVLSLGITSTASAGAYCSVPQFLGDHGSCQGPFQSLSKNAVIAQTNSWATCAGAKTSSGAFYGQYFCASDYSCHTYGGGYLYPMAHNHESFGQYVYAGTNSWADPLTCPRGGPVSAATPSANGPGTVASYSSGDLTCLDVPDGMAGRGVTCAKTASTAKVGLVGVLVPADDTGAETSAGTVVALAPDGASRATVGSQTANVVNGFIQVRRPANASTVRWSPSGATVVIP